MTIQRSIAIGQGLAFAVLTLAVLGPSATTARAAEGRSTACFALPTDEFSAKAAAVLGHLVRENFRRTKKFKLIDIRELLNSELT